jgi:hypothetical protein
MPTQPPKYLYKYRRVDADALAMLASDKVYLSRLDAFNDPFESLSLEAESMARGRRHASQGNAVASSLRVCALSEEHRDLLMWGHYGDSHRGFCIRFEFAQDPAICQMLHPVQYEATIQEPGENSDDSTDVAWRHSLIKSDKWSYEREWRIISTVSEDEAATAELFVGYKPAVLRSIIFGVRTPELHKTLIRTLLSERDVSFFRAMKRDSDFSLAIEVEKTP